MTTISSIYCSIVNNPSALAVPKRRPQRPADLPDRRAMEGAMQQLLAGLQGHAHQDTPLAKAQALMYRAFEEPNEQKRLQLAKDALAISPDCADAYVLLAEHATSRKDALRLYGQGVAAGERALGGRSFSAGRQPLLGPPRNQALHARPAGAGALPVDRRPS
jgi:hypothetical protein